MVRPFCCSVAWDATCVRRSIELCDVCTSINTAVPILGVAAKLISFNGVPTAAAGLNLIGMGSQSTFILYEPVTGGGGPPPAQEPEETPGRRGDETSKATRDR